LDESVYTSVLSKKINTIIMKIQHLLQENLKRLGPDQNDPFEQGWRAAHRRQDDTECPYERGSKEHAEWMNGYEEGRAQPDHYNEDAKKKKPVVVKPKDEIGFKIADIGPGGREHNVKTDAAWDKKHGVKESVTDYNPKSQGGTRKELLAKLRSAKSAAEKSDLATRARKAGATQRELQDLSEGQYQGQYPSKEEAIAYAKEKIKSFRDWEDGIEVWALPSGRFDVVHTSNSNGRNHVVKNGGKKLGTIYPEKPAFRKKKDVAEGSVEPTHQKIINKEKTKTPKVPKDEYERKVEKYLKKKHTGIAENNWTRDPWTEKYFGPTAGAIKKIFKITVQDDESNVKAFNVKAETEQQAKEIIEKHAPGSTVMKIKFVKNLMAEQQLDEISSKLAGDYYSAATKKHVDKVGMRPKMYDRIEKDMGPQRKKGIDRAFDRITKDVDQGVAEDSDPCWSDYKQVGMKKKNGKKVPNCVPKESSNYGDLDEAFNLEEEISKLDEKSAAWQRKEGKSKSGGLNKKGVASYRRANPGSKLQTAVTTKPSKLKPGSKPAKRRKSFCARMSGVKGPMKDEKGKPTRKALALRKWNC
jgi:hypothetical protein